MDTFSCHWSVYLLDYKLARHRVIASNTNTHTHEQLTVSLIVLRFFMLKFIISWVLNRDTHRESGKCVCSVRIHFHQSIKIMMILFIWAASLQLVFVSFSRNWLFLLCLHTTKFQSYSSHIHDCRGRSLFILLKTYQMFVAEFDGCTKCSPARPTTLLCMRWKIVNSFM